MDVKRKVLQGTINANKEPLFLILQSAEHINDCYVVLKACEAVLRSV